MPRLRIRLNNKSQKWYSEQGYNNKERLNSDTSCKFSEQYITPYNFILKSMDFNATIFSLILKKYYAIYNLCINLTQKPKLTEI